MAMLNIPKGDIPELKALVDLDDKTFESLVAALKDSKPMLTQANFARQVKEKMGSAARRTSQYREF